MKNRSIIPMLVGLIALLVFASTFVSCTENSRARNFGGTETINLEPGEKLVTATWKETNLWYQTEPMEESYVPKTKTFHEKSTYGQWQGTVVFIESRATLSSPAQQPINYDTPPLEQQRSPYQQVKLNNTEQNSSSIDFLARKGYYSLYRVNTGVRTIYWAIPEHSSGGTAIAIP